MMTEYSTLQVDPDVLIGENENLIDALNHTQAAAHIVGNSVSHVSKVALQTAMENAAGLTGMAYEGAASLNRLAQDNAENIKELAHTALSYTAQAAQNIGHVVAKTTVGSLETAKVGAEGITELAYESVASNAEGIKEMAYEGAAGLNRLAQDNAENIKELAHTALSYTTQAAQNIGHAVAQTSKYTLETAKENAGGITGIAYGGAATLNKFAHDNADNIKELAQNTIHLTQQAAQTLGHVVAETSKATLDVAKQGAEGITEIAYGGVENLKKIAQTESVKDITHSALDYTQLAVHTIDNALDLTQKAVLYTTKPENIKTMANNALNYNYSELATKFGLSSLREISQEAINYTQQTVQTLGSKIGFVNPSQDSLNPGDLANQNTWENIVKKGQENIDKVQEITANAEKQIQNIATESLGDLTENEQVHNIAANAQQQIQNITTENIQEMIKDSTQRGRVSLE
jgi:hypothetical protein